MSKSKQMKRMEQRHLFILTFSQVLDFQASRKVTPAIELTKSIRFGGAPNWMSN